MTSFIFFLIWSKTECNFLRRHTCISHCLSHQKISKNSNLLQIGYNNSRHQPQFPLVVVGVKVRNNANICCPSDYVWWISLKNQLAFGELMALVSEDEMKDIKTKVYIHSIVFKTLIFHWGWDISPGTNHDSVAGGTMALLQESMLTLWIPLENEQ